METRPITIQVDAKAAQVYAAATADERRKLDALLSLRLTETTQTSSSLEEVMSDISRNAQRRGLTPEILDEILNAP